MNWKTVNKIKSTDSNVFKYVFYNDNAVAESVLYKYPTYDERTVICCSTQSGCPVGCRFCGAGDYFVRSLLAEEIVEQVRYILEDIKIDASVIKKFQIMFMSMGEPMLNLKNVSKAIRELNKLYPNADLLISTMAPDIDYADFVNLSKEIDKIGLQISVHESTDEKRNELIPFKAKLNLKSINWLGVIWYKATGRHPFFNYCAKENNTAPEDVENLSNTFPSWIWKATVSVVCERNENVCSAGERQRDIAVEFANKLLERNFDVRVFNPAGQDDIGGGCGQLWFVQDWMKTHPELAKKSIGNGREIVHSPK
ncbi:MAG: radical SAM protein [Methanogenium sp.]|jgi:23S rRNA (adenine2503-C2)-methyltransferase